MPILYYRANTSNFIHDPEHYSDDLDKNIYDYRDNQIIIDLGLPSDSTFVHPMSENGGEPAIFYRNTLNPNFATPPFSRLGRTASTERRMMCLTLTKGSNSFYFLVLSS